MKPLILASFTENDYVKAMRKALREEEIARHGRLIEARPMKHTSKKAYSRKNKYPLDFDY